MKTLTNVTLEFLVSMGALTLLEVMCVHAQRDMNWLLMDIAAKVLSLLSKIKCIRDVIVLH